MKLTISLSGVPAGSYVGKFVGVTEGTNDKGAFLRWEWEVDSGPQKGRKTGRMTGTTPTLKNACGKVIAGLTGQGLNANQEFDTAACIGRKYLLFVADCGNGATRVESLAPAPDA